MAYTIAVAGKGGSGKTTIAALIIRHLLKRKKDPILAVDADPNFNLDVALGLEISKTISDIREEVKKSSPGNLSRPDQLKYGIEDCLIESTGLDLLVMGRPEGPGCYCAVNNILRDAMSAFGGKYRYIVIDNEAGMEHLSRRTTDNIDRLFLIGNTTRVSIRSAINAQKTAQNIPLKIKKSYLILNGVDKEIEETLKEIARDSGLALAGSVPNDDWIGQCAEAGVSLMDLGKDSLAQKAVDEIMERTIWNT